MSIKRIMKGFFALFLTLILGGCFTTEVEITLNPDGSGTLEYAANFDRASEDVRAQIRQQLSESTTTKVLSKENILELYPEPHFKLITYEEDNEALTTRIVLKFNDINALLIKRKTADLGLKALDFKVDGDVLVFSVKEEKLGQPWPEKYDEIPGMEHITIKNAGNGEQITFSRELTSKTLPADWSERLAFSGHSIVRNPTVQVFHDYPVIHLDACEIDTAKWTVRQYKQWSSLDLKLNASLPVDGSSYVRWESPVALSGKFLPEQPDGNCLIEITGQSEFTDGNADGMELKLPIPAYPVEALDSVKVRVKAYRSRGTQVINLGPLKPNTEYTAGDLTIKTDDLENNRVGFRATGAADRLKGALLETRRGNRFELKKSSWSGTTEKRMSYWEFLPLEGCSLCVEVYNTVEPCYIDLDIPTLDLTQRAWRVEEETAEPSTDWQLALKAEHSELFSIPIPPVEEAMFESKERYKAYFQGLEDQQIMPALVEVVNFMVLHNPKSGPAWIQEIAQYELKGRSDYFKENRENIANQLFSIYTHTPEKMDCLSVFFSNLQLQEFSQPLAIEKLKEGNLRFARGYFYGSELSPAEADVLKSAIPNAESWVDQKELLETLDRASSADLPFVMKLLNDRSKSEFVRSEALSIALKDQENSHELASRIVMDATENASLRGKALSFLMKQEPFPSEALSNCLSSPDGRKQATQALKNFMTYSMRDATDEQRAHVLKVLHPNIPMLEDLAEQLQEYDAKDAIAALEKVRELKSSESP